MQCSACRPTSSARTRVRPLSSSTTWNSCGPSPAVTPVQSDVYGFIRSPVEERGSSCRKTSRSCEASARASRSRGPMTSTGGSVVHMRPLPSDSTTQSVPVSATPKFAPLTPTCASQELLAQVDAAPPRRGRRVVRDRCRARSCARRGRGSRVRLRWIAGTRMCDDQSPSSCRISSAKSVSSAWMPACGERVVQADLVRRQRLDLHDLGRRRGRARPRARSAFASAASRAQCTCPPAAVTAASNCEQVARRGARARPP